MSVCLTPEEGTMLSGVDTVELSRTENKTNIIKQTVLLYKYVSCMWIFWMLLYMRERERERDKPGLLSLSSLSPRPPETPRSLDWSCTFILSLLLIRHTELLREREVWVKMFVTAKTERLIIFLTCVSCLQCWHLRSVNFVAQEVPVQSSTKINRCKNLYNHHTLFRMDLNSPDLIIVLINNLNDIVMSSLRYKNM